jgi:hypothetical protein
MNSFSFFFFTSHFSDNFQCDHNTPGDSFCAGPKDRTYAKSFIGETDNETSFSDEEDLFLHSSLYVDFPHPVEE